MAFVTLGAAPVVNLPVNRPSPSASSFSRISFTQSETLATPLSSISLTDPSAPALYVYCGRGDRKTAKGKRFNHSFGNSRPRNKNKGRGPPRVPMPPSTVPKDSFDIDDPVEAKRDDQKDE